MKHIIIPILMALSSYAFAQLQVDQRIELTGSGSNARISGIEQVSAPDDAVHAQAIQDNALTYAPAVLNGSTYEISLAPAVTTLQSGQIFHFRAPAANSGTCSLKVNGTPAWPISKNFNQPLAANDIRTGQMVSVMFDAANNQFQMLSQIGQASSGLSNTQIFSPVTCVTGKTTITWQDFYPSASVAGYDLNKCLPRRVAGQSNDFGWLYIGVSTTGCSGGSLSGIYTPAAAATWTTTVATTGSSSSWFILNNRTVDILCFK